MSAATAMSANTCPRCGRESGWGLTQCSPRDHESCLGFLRDRAERERDEARAEVERMREQLRDALEDRATMARDVERLSASDVALGKVERILEDAIGTGPWGSAVSMAHRMRLDADELRRLAWEWCIDCKTCADYGYHTLGDVLRLRTEAEELRALAWEWCIEARSARESVEPSERDWSEFYLRSLAVEEERDELRAQLQRLTDDAYEVDHRGNEPEQPIESLGPDVHEVALRLYAHSVGSDSRHLSPDEAYAYARSFLACGDAVRRGARLEGE